MYYKNYLFAKIPTILIILLVTLTACGTYQNVPDNDGIYSSTEVPVEQTEQEIAISTKNNSNSSYYKNYFKEKSSEYEIYTEDAVFTDVDEYGNEYVVDNDTTYVDSNQYAGWGQENSNVTVNVYDTGFGWNAGWGWGYPNYGWGWNAGWGWGYPNYGWGWNAGWGWGYPGYGLGYCPPYYAGGYYGGYYGNNLSYNNGRRGSAYLGRSSRYANNNSRQSRYNTGRRSNASGYVPGRPRADSNTGRTRVRSTTRLGTRATTRNEGRPAVKSGTQTKSKSTRTRTRSNNAQRTRTTTPNRSYNNSSPSRSYSSPSRSGSSMGSGRSSGGRGGRGGF
jgi:hypothetical protein